ncbi:MAG: hypothetical protein Q7S05_01670 [bacterium]|nr:hypothetical protein [bacterium]
MAKKAAFVGNDTGLEPKFKVEADAQTVPEERRPEESAAVEPEKISGPQKEASSDQQGDDIDKVLRAQRHMGGGYAW